MHGITITAACAIVTLVQCSNLRLEEMGENTHFQNHCSGVLYLQ